MKQKDEIRLNFIVSQRLLDMMEEIQEETEMRTRTEVFNTAMSLLQWAIGQTKQGKEIGSFDTKTDRFKELFIPAFQPLYQAAQAKEAEKEVAVVG